MESNIDRLREAISKAHRFGDNWAPALLEGSITNLDPLGQVRVLLDHFRGDDGTGFETDWLPLMEYPQGIGGKLPASWLNRRVLVHAVNHSYETLRVSVGANPLIYLPTDSLPEAKASNQGLTIIRQLAKDSLLYVCVLRNSRWVFEPMSPYFHLHNSGDTLAQGNDSGGDFQQLIAGKPTSDQIYVTTVTPYFKDSGILPPATL